jgi:DNA mismatch endonuclease (patch repair protein)
MDRSENMRRIRSKHTGPERIVRAVLRAVGFTGYRLHWKSIPGKPDIAFVGRKKAILVHGCFWHGHTCADGRRPKSNVAYWNPKLDRNRERDAEHIAALTAREWQVLVIWDCETRNAKVLTAKLRRFLTK